MIYAVTEEDNSSVVKVGYTHTPEGRVQRESMTHRLRQMQTGTWRRLICVALSPGYQNDEQRLHCLFETYRVRGEWFRNEGDVRLWVHQWRLSDAPALPAIRRAKPVRMATTTSVVEALGAGIDGAALYMRARRRVG